MKTVVCNFAPVRFLPYRETEEFVNVGVVVHCPQVNFFGFRLETRKTRRVTDFFPELEVDLLKKTLNGLSQELEALPMTWPALKQLAEVSPLGVEQFITRFRELVRLREGLLHFGPMGTCLIENPKEGLNDLFAHYVERQFARQPEYQEKIMKVKVYRFLKQWKLSEYYKRDEIIGDEDFHITMPFVHFSGSQVERVIRPLNLNQKTPSEIIDHGSNWIGRMDRLRKRGKLPENVIFPINFPAEGRQASVARDLCRELGDLGIVSLPLSENPEDIQKLHEVVREGLEKASPN